MTAFDDINQDVWLPFRGAYAALDVETFESIHAPGFVRVESADRWIGDVRSTSERTAQGFERARNNGDALSIDFRFDDRVLGEDIAYERGVYRVIVIGPDQHTQTFYGRFHAVHRRTRDGWRLLLDHDGDVGVAVGIADFESATPLDATAAFDPA